MRASIALATVGLTVPLLVWAMPPLDMGAQQEQATVAYAWSSASYASAPKPAVLRTPGSSTSSKSMSSQASAKRQSLLQRLRTMRWQKNNVEPQEMKPFDAVDAKQPSGDAKYLNQVGVYLTAGSMKRKDFVTKTMDRVVEVGGNSVIFDVKGSFVYFQTDSEIPNKMGLVVPLYDIKEVLDEARSKGLYTMGRFISVKDDGLSGKRPDLLVKDPRTGRSLSPGWVDPSNAEVLAYNGAVACALAEAGIDEINLDYIRFSTAFVGDLRVFTGEQKADRVEKFVKTIRENIDACGPRTRLGMSTYAILGWNYDINVETLGQDVKRFLPYVDVISPMAYPATFTSPEYYIPGKNPRSRMYWLVYRTLTGYKELLGPEHAWKIRPWIQGYYVDSGDMREQIDAVYDAGACGFTVWNANNNYEPVYTGIKNSTKPEHCK